MLTFPGAVRTHALWGENCNLTHCCRSLNKTTAKFSSNPRISLLRKPTRKDPPVKSDQNIAISVHVLWGSFLLFFINSVQFPACFHELCSVPCMFSWALFSSLHVFVSSVQFPACFHELCSVPCMFSWALFSSLHVFMSSVQFPACFHELCSIPCMFSWALISSLHVFMSSVNFPACFRGIVFLVSPYMSVISICSWMMYTRLNMVVSSFKVLAFASLSFHLNYNVHLYNRSSAALILFSVRSIHPQALASRLVGRKED